MQSRPPLALAAVLALLAFLLVASVVSVRRHRRSVEPRVRELAGLIEERRALVDDLDQAVEDLRAQVDRAQRRAALAGSDAQVRAGLEAAAGTVAVRGPGLEVELSDSTRTPPSVADAPAYRIQDRDLQLTVNALLAAGAEAVSVNGSRVVATTAMRAAGDTIVVNFRPLTPPYRVDAVGADEARFRASDVARRFRAWSDSFGLGFKVSSQRRLTVPAYSGRVAIADARPAGTS